MAMLLMLSSLAGYATYVPIYLSCYVNLYMKADYIPYWPNKGLWWLISGRTLLTLTSLAEQTDRSQQCLPVVWSESPLFQMYLKRTISYTVN